MESKDYIRRDDPEHKKYEAFGMKAKVARSILPEETRPDFAVANNKFLGRQQRLKDKFMKDPNKNW